MSPEMGMLYAEHYSAARERCIREWTAYYLRQHVAVGRASELARRKVATRLQSPPSE